MVVGCVGTSYVLRVELLVQRRLCSIFLRDVGSPDIHECFRGLTGSQRTPGIWGVTDNPLINVFFFSKAMLYTHTRFTRCPSAYEMRNAISCYMHDEYHMKH